MTPIFILLCLYIASSATHEIEYISEPCSQNQANFDMQEIVGSWYVVALIPGPDFPRARRVTCYKMDVSETDEASLRWLVRRKVESPSQIVHKIRGTIVRMRYHSDEPFDVWSRTVIGVNGCFRQLFSLATNKTQIDQAVNMVTYMQLHIMETNNKYGPFLIQMFWGKPISAIIYRRGEGYTREILDSVYKYVKEVKGYQLPIRMCDEPKHKLLPLPFERP